MTAGWLFRKTQRFEFPGTRKEEEEEKCCDVFLFLVFHFSSFQKKLPRRPITTTEPSEPASSYLDLTSIVTCGCSFVPLSQARASPPSFCFTLSKPRFGDFHSLPTAPSSI